jgi:hypothetical protein
MNDGRIIPISEQLDTDLEIAKTLNRMYYSYDMQSSPFAVTGNICVSRGITFASKINDNEFLFTHAVIPDTTNSEDAYQMVSRCNGNIRDFVSYKSPIIFVSTKTSDIIKKQEDMAVSFAKKYWKDEDSTVKITSDMLSGEQSIVTPKRVLKYDPRKTVPIIVSITRDELESIPSGKIERRRIIAELLRRHVPDVWSKVENHVIVQCTSPNSEGSYKRHILDLVKASRENKVFLLDQKEQYMNMNWMNCYIDERENRLCIVVWNGATGTDIAGTESAVAISASSASSASSTSSACADNIAEDVDEDLEEEERQIMKRLEDIARRKKEKLSNVKKD